MESILNLAVVSSLIGIVAGGAVAGAAAQTEMRVSTQPRFGVIAFHQVGAKNFVLRKDNVGGTCWLEVSDLDTVYALPVAAAACIPTPIN